jgi:hypothetical protein
VRGKNVQILIEEGFRPLPTDESSAREPAHDSPPSAAFHEDTNDDVENNEEIPPTSIGSTNQNAFQIEVEHHNDKGVFLCVLIFALISIIVIPIIIIITMSAQSQ